MIHNDTGNRLLDIKVLINGKKTLDELVDMSVNLLKLIHSRQVRPDSMPDMRQIALGWVDDVRALLTPEEGSCGTWWRLCRRICTWSMGTTTSRTSCFRTMRAC